MGNNSNHSTSKETQERQKRERLGEEKLNNQGCLMKIIEYNKSYDIVVEFQDKRKLRVKTTYKEFVKGSIKNHYHQTIYGVGCIGTKYHARTSRKIFKEYATWKNMLYRCYSEKYEEQYGTHNNATVCEEWLCYENFYDWVHEQSNARKFLSGNNWILNRKIVDKHNEIYSPEYCFLVPQNVNRLFIKPNLNVEFATVSMLKMYKEHMESKIKRVAEEEFKNNNISERCYKAMIKYEVEI